MNEVKVMLFMRHKLTPEQLQDLMRIYGDNISINQIDKTIQHANEVAAEIEANDVIAIVAPIELQAEFLKLAGDKPVIISKNERRSSENGEYVFRHLGWFRLKKIDIELEQL